MRLELPEMRKKYYEWLSYAVDVSEFHYVVIHNERSNHGHHILAVFISLLT